jgi:hypothetical protein
MSDEPDEKIPALFATIHFRSERRPDGYTDEDIEDLSIEANKHIPELYEKLKAARDERRRKSEGGDEGGSES